MMSLKENHQYLVNSNVDGVEFKVKIWGHYIFICFFDTEMSSNATCAQMLRDNDELSQRLRHGSEIPNQHMKANKCLGNSLD